MLNKPAILAGAALALVLAIGTAHWTGRAVGRQRQRTADLAERAVALGRQMTLWGALRARERAIEARALEADGRVQTVFRHINHEVIRYVQSHPDAVDCLDADGLRLWRAAATGAAGAGATAVSGGPEPVAGDPAGAGVGSGAAPAAELHGGSGAVSPVAGAVSGAGGVVTGAAR